MREHMPEFFDEHHIDAAAIALFVMQQQFGGMPAPQQAAPSIYDDDIPF